MTKKDLIYKLEKINQIYDRDTEKAHVMADQLLLEFINDEEITKAFEAVHKWYA